VDLATEEAMRHFTLALALGMALLPAAPGHAQWRYTDAKGTSKVSQYKLHVPSGSRDEAVWIGPIGLGKPGLSEAQRQARQREDAYRRIGEAQLRRLPASAR
jgi:hypothetical protein